MKCGIDPGRWKIGFALSEDGTLLFSAVVPKSREEHIRNAVHNGDWEQLSNWRTEGALENLAGKRLEVVYVGDGTSSQEIVTLLGEGVPVKTAEERGTTLEGRRLYWELHPPKGLWTLVPTSMRTPPRDVDDLAAWAILLAAEKK